MRRMFQLSLLTLASSLAFTAVGCLSDDDDGATSGSDAGGSTTDASVTGTTDSGPTSTTDSSTLPEASTVDAGDGGGYTTTPGKINGTDVTAPANGDALAKYVPYRDDLTKHVGCTTDGLATRVSSDSQQIPLTYTPVVLPGYPCAGQDFGAPADDATSTKPIVILVHGNSSSPGDWVTDPKDTTKQPMIANQLVTDGFHVYAVDFRWDKVYADTTQSPSVNVGENFDHGWAVPILESFITAIINKYPTRQINMAGFSVGTTVIRDALRRLHRQGAVFAPMTAGSSAPSGVFQHMHQLYLASGANHGVSTFEIDSPPVTYCVNVDSPVNPTMQGLAACQLGDRSNYTPVPFLEPLNGPSGAWETPCSDGSTAFGQTGVCGGTTVSYTTVVFGDPPEGALQDEFVDQASAMLAGATNTTVTNIDPSSDGYFFYPAFEHHFGSIRSAEGVGKAAAVLEK